MTLKNIRQASRHDLKYLQMAVASLVLLVLTGCKDKSWEVVELGNPPLRVSVSGRARRISDIQLPPIVVVREYYEAEQKKLNPWVFTTLDFVQARIGHSFDAYDSALEYV